MPRHARLDSPGTLHHVMVRGIEQRQIVDDEADRADFVRRLGALAAETGTPIYAWALMRNHLRRGRLPEVRKKIVRGLVENYGVRVAEITRQVEIST